MYYETSVLLAPLISERVLASPRLDTYNTFTLAGREAGLASTFDRVARRKTPGLEFSSFCNQMIVWATS